VQSQPSVSLDSELRDAGQIGPRWRENLYLKFVIALSKLIPRFVQVRIWGIGDGLRHIDRQRKLDDDPKLLLSRREHIWNVMIQNIQSVHSQLVTSGEQVASSSDPRTVTFEFGVAYGYSSNYFLERVRSRGYLHYGFDSFIGLARRFREFPKGAFNTDGIHPNIDDSRVRWVVGDVFDTVSVSYLQQCLRGSAVAVFFFDLDLYEPTEHVLRQVLQVARVGDIFYFDEPLDAEEYVIVDRLLSNQYGSVDFKVLCYSPISAAFILVSRGDVSTE